MAHISTYITTSLTLVASATAYVDIRMDDINPDFHIDVQQTWAKTGTPTGIFMNLVPGYGGVDPAETLWQPIPNVIGINTPGTTVPTFANNYLTVSTVNGYPAIVNPSPGSATPQTTSTGFYLNTVLNAWPRWVRFVIVNQDNSNSVVLKLLADI